MRAGDAADTPWGDERGVNIMGTAGVIDQSHGGAADREDVRNDTSASQPLA